MSSTVLVTGAGGYLGRFVVPALQARGFSIRGLHRGPAPALAGVDWRLADMARTLDFGAAVASCDAVVHLAAAVNQPDQMMRVNVDATRALAAASRAAGVRYFGFASSVAVYGSARQALVNETTPPIDVEKPIVRQYYAEPYMLEYARTKALAEAAVAEETSGLLADLYRPSVIVDRERLVQAGSWSFARKIATAYRRTQYVFVEDAAAAVAHLTDRALGSSPQRQRVEAYNISDASSGTFRNLLRTAFALTGDRRFALPADVPLAFDYAKNLALHGRWSRLPFGAMFFDNAKLLATGFSPPVGFDQALRSALGPAKPAAPKIPVEA